MNFKSKYRKLKEAQENNDTIELTLDKNNLNDPDTPINFWKLAKDKIDVRDKASLNKKLIDRASKVFDEPVILEDLFIEYVPRFGKCDTLGGELVRAYTKIKTRWLNDGDKFYDGYGLETSGSAAKFIEDKMEELEFYDISQIITDEAESGDKYDDFVNELKEALTKLFNTPEGRKLFETPNVEDMRDTPVDEDTWDSPRDYEYSVSYETNDFFEYNEEFNDAYEEEIVYTITENFHWVNEDSIEFDSWSAGVHIYDLSESEYNAIRHSNLDSWVNDCLEEMYDNNGGHADTNDIYDMLDDFINENTEPELYEQAVDRVQELYENDYQCDFEDIYGDLISKKSLRDLIARYIDIDMEETTNVEKELYNRIVKTRN